MADKQRPTTPKAPALKFLKAVMGEHKPVGMTQVEAQQDTQVPASGGRTPLSTPAPDSQERTPLPSNTDNKKR
jgi:hypothetical protein